MKAAGIILLVLLIAALTGVGMILARSDMNVVYVNCVATDPVTQQEYFSMLKEQLENGTFTGTRFSDEMLSSPDQYVFYTWTVRLENNTSLTANAAEMMISQPQDYHYDILQIGDMTEYCIPPHSSRTVSATVLASRDVLYEQKPEFRIATVTWYYEGVDAPTDTDRDGCSRKEIYLD